jgi:hypothetical protein
VKLIIPVMAHKHGKDKERGNTRDNAQRDGQPQVTSPALQVHDALFIRKSNEPIELPYPDGSNGHNGRNEAKYLP